MVLTIVSVRIHSGINAGPNIVPQIPSSHLGVTDAFPVRLSAMCEAYILPCVSVFHIVRKMAWAEIVARLMNRDVVMVLNMETVNLCCLSPSESRCRNTATTARTLGRLPVSKRNNEMRSQESLCDRCLFRVQRMWNCSVRCGRGTYGSPCVRGSGRVQHASPRHVPVGKGWEGSRRDRFKDNEGAG